MSLKPQKWGQKTTLARERESEARGREEIRQDDIVGVCREWCRRRASRKLSASSSGCSAFIILYLFYCTFSSPPIVSLTRLSFHINTIFLCVLWVYFRLLLASRRESVWRTQEMTKNDLKRLRREIFVSSSIKCAKGYVSCCFFFGCA